ncbi:hypothetical protein LJB84_00465 [Bacteroidales bacterium OttesenSCG-928-J19]|nr:hypothetical protein [Bacteroidales bacterium OttesenSCG-928-J19]
MPQENKSEAQQLKELLSHWLKYWYYFVISFVICAVIGGLYYKASIRIWQTDASVSLRSNDALGGSAGGLSQAKSLMSSFGLGGGGGKTNVEDESLKMNSQSHIKEVVKNLGLNTIYGYSTFLGFVKHQYYDKTPIALAVEPQMADTISEVILFNINAQKDKIKVSIKAGKYLVGKYEVQSLPHTFETAWGKYTLSPTEYYDPYKSHKMLIKFASYDHAAQNYREALDVDFHKKTSDIINLSILGDNKALSKAILNEVIDVYNKLYDAERKLVSAKTLEFIDERIKETDTALKVADAKIQQFKQTNSLTDIEADVKYYFTLSGEILAQLLEAESQLKIIEIMTDFLQDEENKYALIPYSAAFSDPALAAALVDYNDQLIKRNEAARNDNQTDIRKSADERLEANRKNLVITLQNTKKGAEMAIDQLKKKEKEFERKLGNIPSVEQNYMSLRREQELQQTIYVFLLQMKEETGVKGVSILPKLQIVDSPYVINEKVSPKIIKYGIVIVLIGGIIIPLILVYSIPFFQTVFRRKKK